MEYYQKARIERSAVPAKPQLSKKLRATSPQRRAIQMFETGEKYRMRRSQCRSSRKELRDSTKQKKTKTCGILNENYNRVSRNAPFLRSTREIACRASRQTSHPKTFLRSGVFRRPKVLAAAERAVASHRASGRVIPRQHHLLIRCLDLVLDDGLQLFHSWAETVSHRSDRRNCRLREGVLDRASRSPAALGPRCPRAAVREHAGGTACHGHCSQLEP